ncbi:MAG TPA: hypothetical protein VGO22_08250 [Pseudorhizobium sp.]|jgi:phosphonate transport system permease protein|nr:hypothetical protein [Pseudorhizobium sp.]
MRDATLLPTRVTRLSPVTFALLMGAGALLIVSFQQVAPSPAQLAQGGPRMAELVARMLPPNLEASFLQRVFWRMIETFQIAMVGTAIGVIVSLPVAWLSEVARFV